MARRRFDYSQEKRRSFRKYRMRCSHCEHRVTFDRLPGFMPKVPNCPYCRKPDWRIDWYRTSRREARRFTCKCSAMPGADGNPMPHRRGSTWRKFGDEECLLACVHAKPKEVRKAA